MRKFYFFSRVVAVLLTVMMVTPLWAGGDPVPPSWKQAEGYSEETPVDLEASFAVGDQFNIIESFPALEGKTFWFSYEQYYDVPKSDNEDVCVFEVSEPEWISGNPFYRIELGNGYCLSAGDAHITVWSFDSYENEYMGLMFSKKYTYNITVHVSNESVPGLSYAFGGENADPSVVHDIIMFPGEKRVNWIGFYYAGYAEYYPPYEDNPATFDVSWYQIGIDPTLTSSNESVAFISTNNPSGHPHIEAVAPGEAIITVTCPDDGGSGAFTPISVSFKVTVTEGQEHPGEGGLYYTGVIRDIDPDYPSCVAYIGYEYEIPTLVNETGSTHLSFSSTDESVATVDENGVITPTGNTGSTTITVFDQYYPEHRDEFMLSVYYPFEVLGAGVEASQFNDILNDGGSLRFDPATYTFTMHNLHKDFLNGDVADEGYYHYLYDEVPVFIDWFLENDIHINITGSNEILNSQRIVRTVAEMCPNVIFEGNGSLFAKIYFTSFVNGVHTNGLVVSQNDWSEVRAEGDTTTNITIDGVSITIERDLTYDKYYPNPYYQIISVDKLNIINKGFIHAFLTSEDMYVSNVGAHPCVITLKELQTDATTGIYNYLEWREDFGYTHCPCTEDQAYISNTYWDAYYDRVAQSFEAGPKMAVSDTEVDYWFSDMNPTNSDKMSFNNSASDSYDGTTVAIATGHTDAEVERILRTVGPQTDSWRNALPGALTIYMPLGSGSLSLVSQVNSGYLLKVMMLDGQQVHTYSFAGSGEYRTYRLNYKLENSSFAVIYLQPAPWAGMPAQRAPQRKSEEPGLLLYGLGTEPAYIGPIETIAAKQDPDNEGIYYTTFYYSDKNYRLPDDGTEAYYATIDENGDLHMTLVAENDYVILKDHAVILKATEPTVGLIPEDEPLSHYVMPEANSADNDLEGTDSDLDAPANCYVLSGHSTDNSVVGVGFYRFSGTLAAHKAYTVYSGSASAPAHRMRFIFTEEQTATSVEDVLNDEVQTTKMVENGFLYIIKNGVRYNAQGQIVK